LTISRQLWGQNGLKIYLYGLNSILNYNVEEILFDGNFNIQNEDILYVEMELSTKAEITIQE